MIKRFLPIPLAFAVVFVSAFCFVFLLEAAEEKVGGTQETTQYHEVMPGETLYRIGMKYGISTDELRRLNNLGPDQFIQPGQKILVVKPIGIKMDQGAKESHPGLITMNFKDVDLGVLIKFISEITGKNFVVDPAVKGQATILSPQKVTIDEAYRVFLSVLEINDFTTVPAGKVIKIIKASEARGKGMETILQKKFERPEDKIITQLYPLKYSDSSDLAKLLRPLVPRTGLLIPYSETNTLIIIDVLSNVNRLMRIIGELDVPGVEEISIYTLENAQAEKLATKLTDLFQEKRGKRVVKQVLKIIPDERTNSLVVLATPATLSEVKKLIERLDREDVKPRARIHIYHLDNAVAEELVKVLSEIPGKGAEEKEGKPKAPLISKDVQISADKATNSLVIVAEQDEYKVIEQVIKELDVPRTMVYVETLIMEVSADKALQLGVEWRFGDEYDGGFAEGSDGGFWVVGTPGQETLQSLASGQTPAGFVAGVIGRAITLGDVTFPSIAAFVKAVRTDNDFNLISTPQILTLDNEEAVIEVAQNIPFVTRVDQGTAITDRAIQSFEYKDVGVTLKVTPQISPHRVVRLTVETTVSRILETTALGGTVLAPTTTKRSTNSTLSVRDGETAVIGGLIETGQSRGKTQTPCLGGIPGLGWLFKQTSDRDQKLNLMVFLTPHIVESPQEAEQLFREKKDFIDKEQEISIEKSQPETLRKMSYE